MKILYISALSSAKLVNEAHKSSGQNPGFAVQKFSRLLAKGFVSNNIDVEVLSTPPIVSVSKTYINAGNETEDNIRYNYIPIINVRVLKHLFIFIYTLFYVFFWGVKNRKNGVIVFDVLKISMSISGLLAAKVLRLKTVGLVTDMPGLMVGAKKKRFSSFVTTVNKSYLSTFSYYVFLTEQMNAVINKRNRPYIVMEGLVDVNMSKEPSLVEKSSPKTLLYAGGLHERYGLKMLVDAFISLNRHDWQLVIYGNGPYEKELREVAANNSSVIYKGVAPNEEVVKAECEASLLVNPRPTTEEFTQYSFPSKNMEYMASGTPLLTTKLPGMPAEYWEYVYMFDEETTSGYSHKLNEIFALSDIALADKGKLAQEFIVVRKNNVIQANRIIQMLSK